MADRKYRVLIGLDRDGTINYDPGYLGKDKNWRDQTRILPGVIEGIKAMKQLPSTHVVVCTNQAGVARRFFNTERVTEINQHINNILREKGAGIDEWYSCPYADLGYAADHGLFAENPWVCETELRKPRIGMLKKAASDIGMKLRDFDVVITVGDKLTDVEMGLNAKGYGIYVGDLEHAKARALALGALERNEGRVFIAKDLEDAAEQIRLITRLNNVLR